jgi:hypothetical protein
MLYPLICGSISAETITPFTNEISLFKNIDDVGDHRGTTLQIISINSVNIGTEFILEFTGDFNWGLDMYEDYDYYLELSIVKPVYSLISVNYQRIYGTFYNEPVNQFGIRLSLFSQ